MKFNKVLVPLDGSPLSEHAISTAVELVGDSSGMLVLLRAVEAHTLPGADPMDAQVQVVLEAEEYLTRMATQLKTAGVKNVETSVWYGPAAPAIVDAARLRNMDVIVMSTHGRTGLGRLILGSVAESVLRGTTVPILLLRAPGAPLAKPDGAGQAKPKRERAHV